MTGWITDPFFPLSQLVMVCRIHKQNNMTTTLTVTNLHYVMLDTAVCYTAAVEAHWYAHARSDVLH